jgi:hypothetical protein
MCALYSSIWWLFILSFFEMSEYSDYMRHAAASPSHLGDSSRITVSSPYPLQSESQSDSQHDRVRRVHDRMSRVEASPSRSVLSTTEYSLGGDFGLHSASSSRNLNDELVENKKLEKDNFDMKMKIFYLEEQLQRYQGDGMDASGVNSNDMNELSADNMSLRIRLEETSIELEQRNALLIKVRTITDLSPSTDMCPLQC